MATAKETKTNDVPEPKLITEATEPKEDENPTIEVEITPEGIEEGKNF